MKNPNLYLILSIFAGYLLLVPSAQSQGRQGYAPTRTSTLTSDPAKTKPNEGNTGSGTGAAIVPNNDPQDSNWGLDPYLGMNAREAWEFTTGSSNVVVAVLGSGIDLQHPDLTANLWKDTATTFSNIKESVDGFNVFNTSVRNPPQDDHGVSTGAAGIIGAKGNNNIGIAGVCWTVKLMPVRVMAKSSGPTVARHIEGLDYIIRRKRAGHNIVAIYNSENFTSDPGSALKNKIIEAGNEGMLFITAAGDQSLNINTGTVIPANYALSNMITAGTYDAIINPAEPPFFSDVLYDLFANFGNTKVHVAGPGLRANSTWINKEYRVQAGTYASAAYVAGAAALIKSYSPALTATQIKDYILNNVRTFPADLGNKVITQGILDVKRAITAVPVARAGDYDQDGDVDNNDYLIWRANFGRTGTNLPADGNKDGIVDTADYIIWRNNRQL